MQISFRDLRKKKKKKNAAAKDVKMENSPP